MTATEMETRANGALRLEKLGRRVGRQQLLDSLSLTVPVSYTHLTLPTIRTV